MNEHALASLLADVVRLEIRTCAILDAPARPTLPPPHDLGAEREVLEAVLSGRVKCADLAPLTGADFYSPVYATFWTACEAFEGLEPAEGALPPVTPSLRAVAGLCERQGTCGPEMLAELERLRDETPACLHPYRAAGLVVLAAQRRALCDAMGRIDGALRLGMVPDAADRQAVVDAMGEASTWWR